jgi:RNA polymerase sigma factor (sigma-70 family)
MSQILKVFLENKTAIKRYLGRFSLRTEDVEDLAQETFIRAFAAESTQKIRFPKALLFRIARNLALNEKAKISNATTDSLEDLAETSVIADVSQIAADDEMCARQEVRLLAQAVANLPPQCSRVFLLRKVNGLSYKQIASRLNISVSTVEKHVALGMLRCSDYLRQKGYEVGGKAVHAAAERKAVEGKDRSVSEPQATLLLMKHRDRAHDAR